jgi:PAS domain-containing protein
VIFALVLLAAASQTLSQVGIIVSIAAVIVPAAWWVAHRVKSGVRAEFAQQLKERATDTRVEELTATLSSLDTALRAHMSSEEETNARIEALGVDLVNQLENLEHHISTNQVNIMKAVMASGDTPAMLHEVWEGGYEMLWANRAYLRLIGLTMAEVLAGGEWLSIEESERDIVRHAAEHAGQRAEDYDGEYTLVKAKTQEVVGRYSAHGHCLKGPNDHSYFLSTLVPVET